MARKKVEVFTAGCGVCEELVNLVRSESCSSCDITVLDLKDTDVAERAATLGIRSVPTVVVDGVPIRKSYDGGYDVETLRASGIGIPG